MLDFNPFDVSDISEPIIPDNVKNGLPDFWVNMGKNFIGAYVFKNTKTGMIVICTKDKLEDEKYYLHVSCSYKDKLPSWEELKQVKDIFVGKNKWAYQILPDEKHYVNMHPNCLHIFSEI